MRSMLMTLLVTASMTGCAAQAQAPEGEGATAATEGSTESALQKGGGDATQTCPGGGAPACVVCSQGKCVWACSGDNTCKTTTDICAYSPGVCRTISFSPFPAGDLTKVAF